MIVSIYIFDGVQPLDFAGPYEVFSTASRLFDAATPPFELATVAHRRELIRARGGLQVTAEKLTDSVIVPDILIVPGGEVSQQMSDPEVMAWIRNCSAGAQTIASVCNGALILGAAGLLAGRPVTTHWEDVAALEELCPDSAVIGERRYIDDGAIVTSAGVAAGIDMSLHMIRRLLGSDLAARTARQMDYPWVADPAIRYELE